MPIISIVTSGTRGDVQPYIALGAGLKSAGYTVRLLSTINFAGLASDAGLEFHSTGESIEDLLQSPEWRAVTENGNFLTILKRMRSEMRDRAAESAAILPPLLEGSDLIVAGMSLFGGVHSIAGALKIPLVESHVFPFTPTREFPSPLLPNLPFGRLLNRLSFHGTRQVFWQSLKVSDAATRQILGLGKAPFWGPFRALARSHTPVLYGYSGHVLPRPADWPEQHQLTGYWFLDAPAAWAPPADLVEFLAAGPPPVYIGFGSMGSSDPHAAGRIALEALERSGQRGVLASGWGGLSLGDLPDSVHMIAAIPHSWLFPRMAAVVHHGGAGTTAAGLRAGVPSIIVPFMGDQPFWGKRVADLGVGPRPIPRKKLGAAELAGAISAAVSDPALRQRAHDLGQRLRAEDGVAVAVGLIERFLNRGATISRG
jgi:sterol 3beta-glucosyltransferase